MALSVDVPRLLAALGIAFKQRGHELQALCPAHKDRNPSWSIRYEPGHQKHGVHACWSCGFSGNPIGLVCTVRGVERDEATAWMLERGVAVREGLPNEIVAQPHGELTDKSCLTFALPAGVMQRPLAEWPATPRRYAESRALDAATIDRWGVGYAVYGRLAGRLVFPVRDATDAIVSYHARAFDGRQPRYLTPHEREHADRTAIYGCEHWRPPYDWVALTEGAINAIACDQAGAPAVAALGGSKVQSEHLLQLLRFKAVAVVLDPDAAGNEATRWVCAGLARQRKLVRVLLPPKQDARSVGTDYLRRAFERAILR